MKQPQYSKNVCEGCGKNFELTKKRYSSGYEDLSAQIEIAPDVFVTVCGSTKNNAYWRHDTEYAPRIGCLRKAYERKALCPGCGTPRGYGEGAFSPVCADCDELIQRAKTTLGDRPTTYSLHVNLVSSVWPESLGYGNDESPRDFAKNLLDTIARIAQCTGPRKGPDELTSSRGICLGGGKSSHGQVAVQLDDKQRAAVEALGAAVKTFADAMYRQGRKDGRDLLTGLATGAVSISDFADKHQSWNEEEEKEGSA
jgi:hypothetical protein